MDCRVRCEDEEMSCGPRMEGKRDYGDLHFAADDEKEEEIGDDWAVAEPRPLPPQ